MSNRRATNNRIRGPQSALTDFLASNNISAAQIRTDYERRRREAQSRINSERPAEDSAAEVETQQTATSTENSEQRKKRKRQEENAIAKIKKNKNKNNKNKRRQRFAVDSESDEEDATWDLYAKSKPLPGQLENCEICNKRFTVTAYSKTGPDGGLLCAKCSRELEAEEKKDKPKKKSGARERRRQVQSRLLDGIVSLGAKNLQELCVEKVADNINDVDEFGDLPQTLLDRLSQILSKKRVITSRTLDLFLRPDLDKVAIYDAGKLESHDFVKIFAVIPNLRHLLLLHAGQFKDEVMEYMLERQVPIKSLQLEAANLISNRMWHELFRRAGGSLEALKLAWLDSSFNDECVQVLADNCPNLKRLKLRKCFHLDENALVSIGKLSNLEHLSLQFSGQVEGQLVTDLVNSVGQKLFTLSLTKFENADDAVLAAIHASCRHLRKFRFSENDLCTDAAYEQLFTDWVNPGLVFADFSSTRDLDYSNPDGPDEPVGLASKGFAALMKHSGSSLERLDISSCRHIAHSTFCEVFDGIKIYPNLRELNLSFIPRVDTLVVAAIFKSCPQLQKVVAFSCFGIRDVIVPPNVALIGIPNAQENIMINADALAYY
ncbi:F-box and leucine-rich repeat protein 20 [Xylona heveae TC161]|uniref:F-box and leucine-rich repeat protein 20 n=1 Tax=Xylona heveae (strain CBS 132557 / TC161) TaxID=1328760 RepID=A0A165IAU1_XYLHT|nr:F-box and leucine-rich repeat protein 20 [Xylona heveae TC161]KZF24641.1 F-box and leucine-rich repeat protein 20 [Xylona heveae TC161]